jgi:hypothetical protein
MTIALGHEILSLHLEAYNLEIGLLINFGETSLNFKRLSNKKFKSTKS